MWRLVTVCRVYGLRLVAAVTVYESASYSACRLYCAARVVMKCVDELPGFAMSVLLRPHELLSIRQCGGVFLYVSDHVL